MQVAKFNSEKLALQQDIGSTSSQLVEAKFTICDLEEECVSQRHVSTTNSIYSHLVTTTCHCVILLQLPLLAGY